MRIIIILFALLLACAQKKGVESVKNGKYDNDQKHLGTIGKETNNLNLAYPISPTQSDTSKEHQFQEIKLMKDHNGIYHSLNIGGYIYSERFPGILNKKNLRRNKIEKIEIFKAEKKL